MKYIKLFTILNFLLYSYSTASTPRADDQLEFEEFQHVPLDRIYSNGDQVELAYVYNNFMVRIEGYPVTKLIPLLAKKHPSITMLCLIDCGPLDFRDMEDLQDFTKLRHLKLSLCGLNDTMLKILTLGDLPKHLISLNLTMNNLTDEGLIAMFLSDRYVRLQHLCIANSPDENAFSHNVFNTLAETSLRVSLKMFYISGYALEWRRLTDSAQTFVLGRYAPYDAFYSKRLEDREVYLIDDPCKFGYEWIKTRKGWFLLDKDELEGNQTSQLLSSASEKLKRLATYGAAKLENNALH